MPEMSEDEAREIGAKAGLTPEQVEKWVSQSRLFQEQLFQNLAQPGVLGLPPLLDKRRIEYGIPNQAFDDEATFDWVHVWQINDQSSTMYEGTILHKPEAVAARERYSAPKGIILSAGLAALDYLTQNGCALGDIVHFIRHVPWRIRVASFAGVDMNVLMLRASEICGSADARTRRRDRTHRVKFIPEKCIHVLINEEGVELTPQIPPDPEG